MAKYDKKIVEEYIKKKISEEGITIEEAIRKEDFFKEMMVLPEQGEEEEETNPSDKLETLARDILNDLWNAGLTYHEIDKILRMMDHLLEEVEQEREARRIKHVSPVFDL